MSRVRWTRDTPKVTPLVELLCSRAATLVAHRLLSLEEKSMAKQTPCTKMYITLTLTFLCKFVKAEINAFRAMFVYRFFVLSPS